MEPMPTFGKGLDLRRAAEEAFEAKDVLSSALDSEALKQTLYRQAKNQVGTRRARPALLPQAGRQAAAASRLLHQGRPRLSCGRPTPAWGTPRTLRPSRARCIGEGGARMTATSLRAGAGQWRLRADACETRACGLLFPERGVTRRAPAGEAALAPVWDPARTARSPGFLHGGCRQADTDSGLGPAGVSEAQVPLVWSVP